MHEILISNGKITKDGKKIESIFRILTKSVDFHKDLTVYGLFKALKPFSKEINLAFASQLGGFDFDLYITEAEKKSTKDGHGDYIDYCEVHWNVDYSKIKKYEAFYLWPDFHGCKKRQKMGYGLDFSPITTYKDKPIILNETLDIGLVHIVNKKTTRTPILNTKKHFTFFEAIGGFLNDISFYGPPKTRDEKGKEIMDDTASERAILMEKKKKK